LLVFEEVKERLRFFEQTYVGIRAIPVAAIVGSSGRSRDFDKNFLPLRPDLRERWTAIERAFPEGGFPPIVVYQVAGSYFVVDGHHRVAIAKLRKQEFIDAEITELRTRYELPEGADIGEIIFREQQHLLMQESGLERALSGQGTSVPSPRFVHICGRRLEDLVRGLVPHVGPRILVPGLPTL